MNRRNFVFSWGRKVFFGYSWPLMSILGLIYFQSYIVPQTTGGWFYYIVTHIGHYGLINALLYFLLYLPVVFVFPSYYVSRFWSLFLVLAANLIVLMDALTFSQYRLHINGMFLDLAFGDGSHYLAQQPPVFYGALVIVALIISVLIWLRGEKIWRNMQSRFSNPMKNWYLGLIAICLVISHSLHIYATAKSNRFILDVANLFPLHFPATAKSMFASKNITFEPSPMEADKYSRFNYPDNFKCEGKDNKNILMVVIEGWRHDELTPEITPHIQHYRSHGAYFANHFSGGNKFSDGIFSLIWSLPPTYLEVIRDNSVVPALYTELTKRNYQQGVFLSFDEKQLAVSLPNVKAGIANESAFQNDIRMNGAWKEWTSALVMENSHKPFFGVLQYRLPENSSFPAEYVKKFEPASGDFSPGEDPQMFINARKNAVNYVDQLVSEVVDDLHAKNLLKDTIIILTGDHGDEWNDSGRGFWGSGSNFSRVQTSVPLILIWPGKKIEAHEEFTTHYDIVPTLMSQLWKCKLPSKNFSFGHSMFTPSTKHWLLVGGSQGGAFGILDFKKGIITSIDPRLGTYSATDFALNDVSPVKVRESSIMKVLKDMNYLFQKR